MISTRRKIPLCSARVHVHAESPYFELSMVVLRYHPPPVAGSQQLTVWWRYWLQSWTSSMPPCSLLVPSPISEFLARGLPQKQASDLWFCCAVNSLLQDLDVSLTLLLHYLCFWVMPVCCPLFQKLHQWFRRRKQFPNAFFNSLRNNSRLSGQKRKWIR